MTDKFTDTGIPQGPKNQDPALSSLFKESTPLNGKESGTQATIKILQHFYNKLAEDKECLERDLKIAQSSLTEEKINNARNQERIQSLQEFVDGKNSFDRFKSVTIAVACALLGCLSVVSGWIYWTFLILATLLVFIGIFFPFIHKKDSKNANKN